MNCQKPDINILKITMEVSRRGNKNSIILSFFFENLWYLCVFILYLKCNLWSFISHIPIMFWKEEPRKYSLCALEVWTHPCCGLNVCCPKIITPNMVTLDNRTFGKWGGHQRGALMNRINIFMKDTS